MHLCTVPTPALLRDALAPAPPDNRLALVYEPASRDVPFPTLAVGAEGIMVEAGSAKRHEGAYRHDALAEALARAGDAPVALYAEGLGLVVVAPGLRAGVPPWAPSAEAKLRELLAQSSKRYGLPMYSYTEDGGLIVDVETARVRVPPDILTIREWFALLWEFCHAGIAHDDKGRRLPD